MGDPCPGCGAHYDLITGATHPYIGANAGCWALYGEMLSGQPASDESLRASTVESRTLVHDPLPIIAGTRALLADAYAAQHHGVPSPQSIQSVGVHLLTLHAVYRKEVSPANAGWTRTRALRRRGVFSWLTPPPIGSSLAIRHLFPTADTPAVRSIEEYVASVYFSWQAEHNDQLVKWYDSFVLA